MKKQAFTLAEVLMTLAIIGVIAALTIPAVVTKVQQDQYVVGLKKAYNTLKTVERQAVQEYGEIKNWEWTTRWGGMGGTSSPELITYLEPYFDIMKKCQSKDECFANSYDYMDKEPRGAVGGDSSTKSYFITSDGISYGFKPGGHTADEKIAISTIEVDVNGPKGPNIWGRDMFSFVLFPSYLGMKPANAYNSTTSEPISSSDIDTNCKSSGEACAAKVLAEGAMNY